VQLTLPALLCGLGASTPLLGVSTPLGVSMLLGLSSLLGLGTPLGAADRASRFAKHLARSVSVM
jgi:hypothetical protein